VFIWSQLAGTGDPAKVSALPSLRPGPAVIVGGPGWVVVPPGTVLAADLRTAVDLIAVAAGA